MAIDTGTKLALAVVQVKGLDELEADKLVEFPHRRLVVFRGAERITGRQQMARIDTNAQPARILNPVEDRRELLEPPAKIGPLAGRVFQECLDRQTAGLPVDFVQGVHDSSQPRLLARGRERAGTSDDAGNSPPFAPLQAGPLR